MKGTILRVSGDKGFGFIKGEDNKDYFFHRSDINMAFGELTVMFERGLTMNVQFISIPSDKGPRASAVKYKE